MLVSSAAAGQIKTQSEVDLIVKLAVILSEEALFDAKFTEARNIVELSYFENIKNLQPKHRLLLTMQDLRISGFMNIVYAKKSNPKKNFEKLQQFLPIVNKLDDPSIRGNYFLAFSNAHRSINNQDSAIIYQNKATSSFTEIQDFQEIAKIRASDISRLHNQLLQKEKTDEILKLIPRYNEEIEFSSRYSKYALAYNTRHLGQIYRRQTQEFEVALELFQTSLELREEIGFMPFIPASHSSIGDVLKKMGRYTEAIKSYLTSAELAEEIGFIRYQSYPLLSIGDCYLLAGDKTKALEYYTRALKVASSNNYSSDINEAVIKIKELKE